MLFSKNKTDEEYLRDLRKIQTEIKLLEPPTPPCRPKGFNLDDDTLSDSIYLVVSGKTNQFYFPDITLSSDFWKELGEYFLNMHRYYSETVKNKDKLEKLKIKEDIIKNKLGIQ